MQQEQSKQKETWKDIQKKTRQHKAMSIDNRKLSNRGNKIILGERLAAVLLDQELWHGCVVWKAPMPDRAVALWMQMCVSENVVYP